jgi:nitrogen regulatory protein P-II 1
MKLITAIICPEKLEAVRVVIDRQGLSLLSVSQVIGDRSEAGYSFMYRGRTVHSPRPKLRLEIAADEKAVAAAIKAIVREAATESTEQSGDGKVFVTDLYECVNIRGGGNAPAIAS